MKFLSIVAFFLTLSSCIDDMPETTYTIWEGPNMEFVKETGSNSDEEINQDRISPSVWITRKTSGGQIFNILLEESATKGVSPLKTKWAEGKIENLENLAFSNFREAVGSPKFVVGKDLVLHLEEENVYLTIKFKSWDENQGGGFSYERSTPN